MLGHFIKSFGILLGYFALSALIVGILRYFLDLPKEVFRKTLHVIVVFSSFILLYAFGEWWLAVLVCLLFILLVYPLLYIGERIKGFSRLMTARRKGELKKSLVAVFAMFVLVLSIGWGLFDKKYLVLASVFAWGFGDAAAALVGKRFGKHTITGKWVEGTKSIEGTVAMAVTAFIPVFIILFLYSSLFWYQSIFLAALTAVVTSLVELYTRGGMDTITCPLAALFTLVSFIQFLGA